MSKQRIDGDAEALASGPRYPYEVSASQGFAWRRGPYRDLIIVLEG